MMQINVAQLIKENVGSIRSLKIDDTVDFNDEEISEYHFQGEVALIRTDRGILVTGILEGNGCLMCSRCLASFGYPLKFKLEEEFQPAIDVISGGHMSPPEDSSTFLIDEHHVIDLNEAVRQYALLNVPMKPLCRPDCAGLCSNCGADLNQSVHYCK